MCPLCSFENENIIFKNSLFRIILVDEIPGYIRLITNKHIKEISELDDKELFLITKTIKEIEKIVIKIISPDKINIASLGNYVPHLHFHIIPRFKNDPWWPDSTFCNKKREFKYPKIDEFLLKDEIKKCLESL